MYYLLSQVDLPVGPAGASPGVDPCGCVLVLVALAVGLVVAAGVLVLTLALLFCIFVCPFLLWAAAWRQCRKFPKAFRAAPAVWRGRLLMQTAGLLLISPLAPLPGAMLVCFSLHGLGWVHFPWLW
jgi:hypothetical protein